MIPPSGEYNFVTTCTATKTYKMFVISIVMCYQYCSHNTNIEYNKIKNNIVRSSTQYNFIIILFVPAPYMSFFITSIFSYHVFLVNNTYCTVSKIFKNIICFIIQFCYSTSKPLPCILPFLTTSSLHLIGTRQAHTAYDSI